MVIAWMAIVAVAIPNPKSPYTYMAALKQKVQRLKTTPGERIVLIGGSNLAYGIVSPMIEATFKRPVVNMGISAGLGLQYHLESIVDRLHPGDVVVVSPEYCQFQREVFEGSVDLLEAIFEFDLESVRALTPARLVHVVRMLPEFACQKTLALFKVFGLKRIKKRAARYRFNEQGDFISHVEDDRSLDGSGPVDYVSALPDDRVFECLRRYRGIFEDRGIRFILLPQPLQDVYYDSDVEYICRISDHLARMGIPYAASPRRYRMPSNLMFDTHSHTTYRGAKVRTERLIEDIAPIIRETAKKR